jgi:hypothetical protein
VESPQEPTSVVRAPRRGWGVAAIALALALAVFLAGAAFYLLRSPASRPTVQAGAGAAVTVPYQLIFSRTAESRYRANVSLHLSLDSSALGLHKTVVGTADVLLGMRQLSQDDRGVTTVEVAFQHGSRVIDGARKPFPRGSLTVRLTPDGQVLSSSGDGGIAGSAFGFDLPSMEQFTPVLPNRKVAPGDSWNRKISVPFFLGTFRFSIHSVLERYTRIDGTQAAVIHSTGKGSIRMNLAGEDAELLIGQPAPLSAGGEEKLTLSGGSTFDITDVVDLTQGHWYRSTESSASHLVLTVSEDSAAGGYREVSVSIDGTCSGTMRQIS